MAQNNENKSYTVVCPLCNQKSLLDRCMQNHIAQAMLDKVPVYCYGKPEGCGWQGRLGDLDNHYNKCKIKDK